MLGGMDYQELLETEDEDDYAAPAEVLRNNASLYLSQKQLGATPPTAIGIFSVVNAIEMLVFNNNIFV